MEAMTAEHPGEGGFGNGQNHLDLGVGAARATQGEDLGFELGACFAGLVPRSRRAIGQALGEAGRLGASQPAANGLFADAVGRGSGAQGEVELMMSERHLSSRQRSESGISVHVVRAGGRWVESSSTTSLPDPFRADNLLKHDT